MSKNGKGKGIKELKAKVKNLPDSEKLEFLQNEIKRIETELNAIVELQQEQVLEITPELFKQPTDEEVTQVVAMWLSDEKNHHHIQEMIDEEGIDTTPSEVIKLIREPINDEATKWVHRLFRRAYNKLNKDLKFLKENQIYR